MSRSPRDPVTALKGVGAGLARALADAGIITLGDLLWHLPYRYEDRSAVAPIATLKQPGQSVTVCGRVIAMTARRARNRRMTVVQGLVEDATGALPVVWFNQPYLRDAFKTDRKVWLYGPLRPSREGWGVQLVSPEWEVEDDEEEPVHLGRVVPIYRKVGALSGRRIRTLMARALEAIGPAPESSLDGMLPARLALPPRWTAIREVHFPPDRGDGAGTADQLDELARRTSPGQRRLAFEELLALAIDLERARAERSRQQAIACPITDEIRERARRVLPFALTRAQRRVLSEIVGDLQRGVPMARLLQGDVGSGKTIVATLAALVVLEAGAQVALLAPTEVLAQQHFITLQRFLGGTGHALRLLTGSLTAGEKDRVRAELAGKAPVMVVGTHALLQESVAFGRLGLAIVDEQHRFGVSQRQSLLEKGDAPHLLVMTATPIPRSLALSLYGDLDVSVLDELPPGRTPIRTVLRDDGARNRLIEFLRQEIDDGGRVYWVFPLIEESETISARAVESHAKHVRKLLGGLEIGVVHGRLAARERVQIMAAFAAGAVQVLCATTVIEVGIDVPEASVMVIENAERFGLAQLHQLRGRVGRGPRRSYCVLLTGTNCSEEARERLEIFAATADGFRIAEEDFRLRGPGEFTGVRQWGRPEFRIANLIDHGSELAAARAMASEAARRGELQRLADAMPADLGVGRRVATA